jgi:UDP-glucose 4-epimerase
VGDVASVVERLVADQGNSGVFNIGSGQTRSLVEVMGEVGKLIGRPVPCEWRPGADAGVSVNGVSIAKARAMLGFQPIDLRTGLQRTLSRSITGGER